MIRRRLFLVLGVIVVTVTVAGLAFAFWTTVGAGIGSATVGTLNPPTNVSAVATPGSGTVAVSWTASAQSTGYYVTQIKNSDSSTASACGTTPTQPTTGSSCNDLGVLDGTYHYTVTALYASWTAISAPSGNVTVVNTRPSVTVNQAAGQADPSNASTINFAAVFSETVTDFTSNDVTVGGTAPGTTTVVVTGSGTTYNIAVSGMTGSGSVTASIAANTVHNAAGAGNTASTSTDNTVTYDVTLPTAPAPGATAAVTFGTSPLFVNHEVVTLTDAATDAHSGVSSVSYYYCTGASGSCTSANWTAIGSSTTSAGNFSATTNAFVSSPDGPYQIVAIAVDNVGNSTGPSAATPVTVDTTPPTVSRPTVNGNS
jgi:hypothetical protein